MQNFEVKVPITTDSLEHATEAVNERLGYNEDYGFPYQFGQSIVKHFDAMPTMPVPAPDFGKVVEASSRKLNMKKAMLLVGVVYYLGRKASPYYKSWRFARDNPTDPRAIQMRDDWARARANVKNFGQEARESWKRSGVTDDLSKIKESNPDQ